MKQWSGKKCPVPEGSSNRTEMTKRVDEEDSGKEIKLQRLAGRTLTLDCPLPDGHPAVSEMALRVQRK